MATPTKQPAKKFKTKLEDPEKDKKPTEMETMLARLEELESRLSKYEQDEENEDDEGEEGKAPLKATDPSVEPKVENDEKDTEFDDEADSTALEDGEPDGDEEDEEDEEPKKEKMSKGKFSKKGFSAKASRRDIIALAAKFGMKLAPAGAGDSAGKGKKNFETLVAEKTTELKGDKNAAIRFVMANHKSEYAEYRKNFVTVKTTKTL